MLEAVWRQPFDLFAHLCFCVQQDPSDEPGGAALGCLLLDALGSFREHVHEMSTDWYGFAPLTLN